MINVLPEAKTRMKLRDKTCEEFVRAIHLIKKLDDQVFVGIGDSAGGIGTHFRHNYDLANNFLNGLDLGKIDYATRERDIMIEQDRQYAIGKIENLVCRMEVIPNKIFRDSILVVSEIEASNCHTSSVSRELEFVHGHTVHHHAMIAEKLRGIGSSVSADFGVAPSTLEYWKSQADRS